MIFQGMSLFKDEQIYKDDNYEFVIHFITLFIHHKLTMFF